VAHGAIGSGTPDCIMTSPLSGLRPGEKQGARMAQAIRRAGKMKNHADRESGGFCCQVPPNPA
jgi:hypothetical protein